MSSRITLLLVLQCVAPFMVATSMGGEIVSASYFVPDGVKFARAAVATIGIKNFTFGCFSHTLLVKRNIDNRRGKLSSVTIASVA